MFDHNSLSAVRGRVEKFVEAAGFIFVDFQYRPGRKKDILRFLVDKVGGITLDECAQLNRRLSPILDEIVTGGQSYVLEVCSPGADRPLLGAKDFTRALGRAVRLELNDPAQKFLTGTVKEIRGNSLLLSVEGELKEIALDQITSGRITYKF